MKLLMKHIAGSRLGQLLYLINLSLMLVYYAQVTNKQPPNHPLPAYALCQGFLAGHYLAYHSALFQVIAVPNFFPLYISHLIVDAVVEVGPAWDVITYSWVAAYLFVALSTIQWLGLGYFIEKMVRRHKGLE